MIVCEKFARNVAILLAIMLGQLILIQQRSSAEETSSRGPFWRQPGCFRVGHTRLISIPGCIKFNLTTNACRGYCMSYAIPTTEELGVLPQAHSTHDYSSMIETILEQDNSSGQLSDTENKAQSSDDSTLSSSSSTPDVGSFTPSESDGTKQVAPTTNKLPPKRLRNGWSPQAAALVEKRNFMSAQQAISQLVSFASPIPTHLSGERRDIVSVSQCCNMMDTEEVVVNLRCGVNETRRLIFKSAKTCECFFCKNM